MHTDAVLLGRLLRNLLANALRYTEHGGVLVACRRRGNQACLEVWDTGVGIPAALQTQVFEEFYQAGNPQRDRRNGVGLGLSIVARLASLLGFRVELASRVGKGSRFSILIPLRDEPESVKPARELLADGALVGLLVVVIDDEPAILEAMSLLLRQYGCHVLAAESLVLAQRQLGEWGLPPDLLIVDQRLGGGETGLGAAQALRAQHGAQLPVLLVTGESNADVPLGSCTLLQKPVERDRLRQVMLELL